MRHHVRPVSHRPRASGGSALTGVPCRPNFVRMSPPERLSKPILPKKPSGALSEESQTGGLNFDFDFGNQF
jgi:hypothetical protein